MLLRIFLLFGFIFQVGAQGQDEAVLALYNDWQDSPLFETQVLPKLQLQSFVKRAQILCKEQPNNPDACALCGMIEAFYASQISNLEGLKAAKRARDELQHALSIDANVFNGDVYAELGMLYHRTPGWPFSFGSQVMAERLINKALEVDPFGLVSNLRCGEFWFDQKDFSRALSCFQTAFSVVPDDSQQSRVEFQLLQARQMLAKMNH